MKLIIQWWYDTIKTEIIPEKRENFYQMIHTNFHTHSRYCDGTGDPEEYVLSALERGFKALGFSSHAPLPFENDWTMKEENLESYLKEIESIKRKYQGKIEIYTGLEIDFIRDLMSPADSKYTALGLDFIIGSVHVQKDVKTGEYPGIEYTTKDMDQLLHNTFRDDIRLLVESYYRDVMEMIEIGGFSFLGHFDVVKKTNSGNRYFDETAQWYRDAAAKALERVHKMGIIMEVNTGNSRWTDEGSIYPSPWILHLAKKKDIPVILNSDAHKPDRIDAHFPEALRILKDAGYREIVYLKGKKIIPQKLS